MCPLAIGFREKDIHILTEVKLSHNNSCPDPLHGRFSLFLSTHHLISILLFSHFSSENLINCQCPIMLFLLPRVFPIRMLIFETYTTQMGLGAFQHFISLTLFNFFFSSIISGRESAIKKQEIVAAQQISTKDTFIIIPMVSFMDVNSGHPNEIPGNGMLVTEHKSLIYVKPLLFFL